MLLFSLCVDIIHLYKACTLHLARKEDRAALENELRKAHVVVIVYSIDDSQSFDRIPEYWLPTLRSLGVNVPVVLCGNKIDLRTDTTGLTNEALEEGKLHI